MNFRVTFDGSTNPGSVVLSDGLIEARAEFNSDDAAKLFYGLALQLKESRDLEHQKASDLARLAQELAGQTLSIMARQPRVESFGNGERRSSYEAP